jgi:hypothetical protein
MDCDEGHDSCRLVGSVGRCFYSGTGAMASGVPDLTPSLPVDLTFTRGHGGNAGRYRRMSWY